MGKQYHHLSERDRIFLRIMLEQGYPKSKIANNLGVHRSTIYREIKRNSWCLEADKTPYYSSYVAQKKYQQRRQRDSKIKKDKLLRGYVHEKLRLGWSPWQIEGRLKYENEGQCVISHESIYRYIYSEYNIRHRFYKYLRRKHTYRLKQHSRKPRVPEELLIKNRPDIINQRQEFGHWECDLMMFKRDIKSNLITLRERLSRFIVIIKNANKMARGTAITLISTLTALKPYIKSITLDQGIEFRKFPWINDCLDANIYFCDPASPHQKGAIENANGVIRAELPRDYNIEILQQSKISELANTINDRPLKCLGYQTPSEIFLTYMSH